MDHWLVSFLSSFVCMNSLRIAKLFLSFFFLTFVSWLFLAKPFSLTLESECVWLVKNQWLVESQVFLVFYHLLIVWKIIFLMQLKRLYWFAFYFCFHWKSGLGYYHCLFIGFLFSVLSLSWCGSFLKSEQMFFFQKIIFVFENIEN